MNASPEGTEKFFLDHPIDSSRIRNFHGLKLSALGAGTYLGASEAADDQLYEESLLNIALSGINCFDTAINYRSQRSERTLGKVFRELANRGVGREQLFISTKGGFFPEESSRNELLEQKIIEPSQIIGDCHCMAPRFLESQIEASLKNLGIASIDLYYLHNPELELAEVGEEEFYRRLEAAFRLLEQKVQEKKICAFGMATWNGFRLKPKSKALLDLAKVVACARKCGEHFRAIQLPFNLVMLEALRVKNQMGDRSILEAAKELNIAVMASASLMQGQVKGIAKRIFDKFPPAFSLFAQAIEFVLSTPGVQVGYVGMKHVSHAEENAKILSKPAWTHHDWQEACLALGLSFLE